MEQHINPELETLKIYAIEFWNNPISRLLLAALCAVGLGQWLGSLI